MGSGQVCEKIKYPPLGYRHTNYNTFKESFIQVMGSFVWTTFITPSNTNNKWKLLKPSEYATCIYVYAKKAIPTMSS